MSRAGASGRRRAERRGRLAESVAGIWLQLKGYRLLARRVRSPVGEFDLAAQRGRTLAIVEVKARPTIRDGLEAVTPSARRRICAAGAAWAESRPAARGLDLRFDLVIITPWSPPRHVRDAWRPDDPA